MGNPRNVLLLIFDDLSPMLGCYGDPIAKTPNIDRLAARGVAFNHAHAPCAICSPGRATIFTGLRPDQHGVTQLSHKLRAKIPDVNTWPQALRARGWHTSGVGKVFHKGVPDSVASPGNELNNFGCGDVFSWDAFHSPGGMELNCNGVMRNYTPRDTHIVGTGGAISWLRAEKGDNKHHDWKVAEQICKQIRHHVVDEDAPPAFWAAGFVRPHVPLVAPLEYFELYDDVEIPLSPTPKEATPLSKPVDEFWCSHFNLSDDQRREAIRAYYATVSFADAQVGRILDQLEASGLADDTVVMLTADHGFQLGEHGLWFKNYLYQESTRIPLIIADPHLPSGHGQCSDALVDQSDIFPTLFDLLDLDLPPGQDFAGQSLQPVLQQPSQAHRKYVHTQVNWGKYQGRCVRDHSYAYVSWDGDHQQELLFDLQNDPGEFVDLLHGGGGHEKLEQYRAALVKQSHFNGHVSC